MRVACLPVVVSLVHNYTDIDEYTEEGLAHSQNIQQCVSILLNKGSMTVDSRDGQGLTPLHWAIQLPSEYMKDFITLSTVIRFQAFVVHSI